MHQNAGFCIKNIQKKSRGRPPDPAEEGETFVRTHLRAHPPDAGAPPLLVGWRRPWTYVRNLELLSHLSMLTARYCLSFL